MSNTPRLDKIEKNYLINGNFDFWQRGTSFTATGYGADRWHMTATSTPSFLRSSGGPATGSILYATMRTTANTQSWSIRQPIESVLARELAGQTVVFSVLLKRNAAYDQSVVLNIQTNTTADTSTGGSWVTLASTTVPNASISTSEWTQFYVTANVSASVQGIGVQIAQGAVTAGNPAEVYISQAKLSIGSVPGSFSLAATNYATEFATCKRYYQRWDWDGSTGNNPYFAAGVFVTATRGIAALNLSVEMRTAPTLSTSAATDFTYSGSADFPASALALRSNTTFSVELDGTVSGATVGQGNRFGFRATVGAKWLALSAEL